MWWIFVVLALVFLVLLGAADFFFRFALRRQKPVTIPEGEEEAFLKKHPKDQWRIQRRDTIKRERAWAMAQPHQDLEIPSFDGLRLHGLLISPAQPSRKIAVAVHGYRCCGFADFAGIQRFYVEQGFHLLLVDDRAHGESQGTYLGFGWLDRLDCKAWCQELVRRFGPDCSILLHGVSMGAATVLSAAGESLPPQVKGVVGDCGFTSAWDQFRYILRRDFHLPPFPLMYLASLICRLRCGYFFGENSALKQLRKSRLPLLIIHGDQDDYVPTQMSARLLEASGDPGKKRVLIPGAAHAESYKVAPELYQQALTEFFRRVGMEKENREK